MPEGNPQLEDGYIKIATEIYEALIRYRIPGEQEQCLKMIIRKTYGWNKKWDIIALSQFVKATGILKSHVCRALNELEKKHIIITKKGNRLGKNYCFNKKYKTWKSLPKKVTLPKKVMSVTQKGNLPLPKKGTTIDTSTKDTVTKDKLHCEKKGEAVLRYLNRIKGSKYRDASQITARLNNGGTIKECIQIINNKIADEYFQKNPRFLNPVTLFRKSHWDKYLNDTPDPMQNQVSKLTQQNIRNLKQWGNNER
jgi:phage replication O-like protein O